MEQLLGQIFSEPYQILFIMSICVLIYFSTKLLITMYAKIRLGKNTRYELSDNKLIIILVAIALFIAYLL